MGFIYSVIYLLVSMFSAPRDSGKQPQYSRVHVYSNENRAPYRRDIYR